MLPSLLFLSCSTDSVKTVATPTAETATTVDPMILTMQKEALSSTQGMSMLVELCDDIGNRIAGSPRFEQAVDWGVKTMRNIGLENVEKHPIRVKYWKRGEERLTMISPRQESLGVLGLGMGISTPPSGIEADAVVLSSFDELETVDVREKMVVFNVPFTNYGETVAYRTQGPTRAAEKGAVAALVRSVGPVSLYTPHTGSTRYNEDWKIPAAAITLEDAERFARYQQRGKPLRLSLFLESQEEDNIPTSNVIGDILGADRPDQIVVMGCHLDSWDVGQGAQDDGAGCAIVLDAARVIAQQEQRPKRTIRTILYSNEENGLAGAKAYANERGERHLAAIEADIGAGAPMYFSYQLPEEHPGIDSWMPHLEASLQSLGLGDFQEGYSGADVGQLVKTGTVGFGLRMDTTNYWPIHHTHADTIDKIELKNLQKDTAAVVSLVWVLANMPLETD
ncbi:MAG: M20/M25/M40 family metallo-hydrolase [Myxococcota bacterium]|nr:M20/M25/M40 family metallo-hydrolase [Myxococcota bacterium]